MKELVGRKTILIVGRSQFPQGVSAKNVYDSMGLAIVLDCKYGVIIQVTPTLVTELTKDFLSDLLVGCSLMDGTDEIEGRIKKSYYGGAQNALIAAVKDLHRKYEDILKSLN
jgi:hypothetical protein